MLHKMENKNALVGEKLTYTIWDSWPNQLLLPQVMTLFTEGQVQTFHVMLTWTI